MEKSVMCALDLGGFQRITTKVKCVSAAMVQELNQQWKTRNDIKIQLKQDDTMILNINCSILLDSKITAHQYLLCYFISKGNIEYLQTYLSNTKSLDSIHKDLAYLKDIGFILDSNETNTDNINYSKICTTANFNSLTEEGDYFDELVMKYPFMVVRPDGNQDFLRTNLDTTRLLYNRATKNNKGLHDIIIKCLVYEVEEKTRTGKLCYMKRLPKWLEAQEWKNYEPIILGSNKTINNKTITYGNELG
jgi:hypothetical protein